MASALATSPPSRQRLSPNDTLAAAPAADIVIPNAGDLTWATVDLAPATMSALVRGLATVPDDQARAVAWGAVLSGVYRGTVDPRLALDIFTAGGTQEPNDVVLARVSQQLVDRVIPSFLPHAAGETAMSRVAGVALRVLREAEAGSGRSVTAARDDTAMRRRPAPFSSPGARESSRRPIRARGGLPPPPPGPEGAAPAGVSISRPASHTASGRL